MAAYRQGIDTSPGLVARAASEKKYAVLRLYAPTVIDTVVHLSLDDIKSEFRTMNTERRVRQIVVDDSETAEKVEHLLESGADFVATALEYSRAKRVALTHGDLGWVKRGRLLQPVETEVFSMGVGSEYRIAQTDYGFHILQVTEERLIEPVNPDSTYSALLTAKRQEVLQERESGYMKSILDQSTIEWNEGICERFPEASEAAWNSGPKLIDYFAADTAEVVLEFNGIPMTLGQALREYSSYNPGRRPVLKTIETVKHFFQGMALENALYREALEQGFGERPEVARVTEYGVDIWLADRADELLQSAVDVQPPSDVEIKHYYDEHPDEFHIPRRIVIGEITTLKKFRIDYADSLLKDGQPFNKVASVFSEGLTARSGGRLGPFKKEYRPNRWAQADTLDIGERTPPFEEGEQWVIVELRKRVPPRQLSMEEARQSIIHRILKKRKEARREEVQRLLNEWFPVSGTES
jgi:parvulin-like peptidyl-prolyl isomerase